MGWHGMSSNVATPYKLFNFGKLKIFNYNYFAKIMTRKPKKKMAIDQYDRALESKKWYLLDFVVPRKILGPRFFPSNLSGAWEAGCFQALVADCTQSFLHNFECSKQLLGIWTWAMVSINVNHVYKRRIKDRLILQICEERAVRKTNLLGLFQRVASQTSWKGQSKER